MTVKFLDLRAAYEDLKAAIDDAISASLASGQYIGGSDVEAFEAAFGPAAAAARSAGQARTDSWIAAQEEVSRAEAARAGTTLARADLDRLALERSDLPTSVGDQAALDSAIAVVDRLAVDQQSRLDRLKALIAG